MSFSALRAFDSTRALQATAVLLRRQRSRQLASSRLLALLYFADRECIAETGRPIVGGKLRGTNRGPVLETMSRLIRGEHVESPQFMRYIDRDHYLLELTDDPGNGSLSRYEISKLNDIAQRFEASDDWEVAEAVLALPESRRRAAADSTEITLEHVLEAVGRCGDRARILEDAASDAKTAAFFSPPVVSDSSHEGLGHKVPAR